MKFQELSDKQWNVIQKRLPSPAKTGRPRHDDRTTINGIIFVLVTGCRWDVSTLQQEQGTADNESSLSW